MGRLETHDLTCVFVHGTSGWGSYDERNERLPYWGMRNGDLMAQLRARGFDCHAASVSPFGSAWDRACELYAQLSGTRVDYGLAHSQQFGHERFGSDFTGRPLIDGWDERTRLVLVGHSFGGMTARLFAELMAHGDETERAAAGKADISPLFAGGMGQRVAAIVCMAAVMNGNPVFDMLEDPTFDPDAVKVPWWSRPLGRMMSRRLQGTGDANPLDCANHDMRIDQAPLLNRRMGTLPHVLYFSVPCSLTRKEGAGWVPERGMEPFFVARSLQMGHYTGTTKGGVAIGPLWQENDGRVSTISEVAPLGAPCQDLDTNDIRPGTWNVYPTYHGDHMSLQGGLLRKRDVRPFYEDMLAMIACALR